MKLEETKIYLITNCYGDPNKVYIGKTKNCRYKDHKKKYGFNIVYTIIDNIKSLECKNWEPFETYWIEQFRQWGFDVLNKNKGGGGPITHSEETRQKMSKINKGKSRLGSGPKIFTVNHLNKIRIAAKNKNKNFYKNNSWVEAQCKPIIQYNLNNNIIKEWVSIKQASETLNINRFSISQCLSIKINQKTAGGFIWKYKEN